MLWRERRETYLNSLSSTICEFVYLSAVASVGRSFMTQTTSGTAIVVTNITLTTTITATTTTTTTVATTITTATTFATASYYW